MTILLVNECEKDTILFKQYLHEMEIKHVWHYRTVEAAQDELTEAQQMDVDVVVVNMDCTYESRDQVYGNIATLQQWIQAPIILITSYDTRETIGGAFFAGIYDFMLKPVDFSYFKARLHIAIQYHSELRRRKLQEYNLQQDLLIAKKVQKSALSPSLKLDWLQLDGFNRMSHTLGGDMYCWCKTSEHTVSTVLYDVMGHGVASALVSMSIRSILREMMAQSSDPVQVIQELNRHIYELFAVEELDSFLVTAIYVQVDYKKRTIEYVNAAHPAGYLLSESHTLALTANTPILGLLPSIKVQKQTVALNERMRLVLYTDGLQQQKGLIDGTYFQDYIKRDNNKDLQQFVTDYHLDTKAVSDDISLVFLTISSG